MNKSPIVLITLLLSTVLFGFSDVQSEKLEALGHFKQNRNVEYNDVWGYTDAEGREYALLGVRDGTSIINITDADHLTEIAFFKSANSIWKDIKTYKNYAYVVTDQRGVGMQILDLSGLPEKVELVNTYTGFKTSHNLYIDTERGLLFVQGGHGSPVSIMDLNADPVHPVKLSSFGVECHDMYAQDGLVYISEGGHGTIGIFSYENPTNPMLVSRFEIPNAGYVHNSWLNEDGTILMTTEENDGKTIKIWDVSDLNNVELLSEVLAEGNLAHNAHIKGNYAYVSHYGSGLRIYNLTNPSKTSEVAFFQKGDRPTKSYSSAWGAYPFFKSGKILVSDIEDGLYVTFHGSAKEGL